MEIPVNGLMRANENASAQGAARVAIDGKFAPVIMAKRILLCTCKGGRFHAGTGKPGGTAGV